MATVSPLHFTAEVESGEERKSFYLPFVENGEEEENNQMQNPIRTITPSCPFRPPPPPVLSVGLSLCLSFCGDTLNAPISQLANRVAGGLPWNKSLIEDRTGKCSFLINRGNADIVTRIGGPTLPKEP